MNDCEYTAADLEGVTELERLPGYVVLRRRIEAEIERLRDELERQIDQSNTDLCRGGIGALRMVLALPEILRSEISAELKEEADGR